MHEQNSFPFKSADVPHVIMLLSPCLALSAGVLLGVERRDGGDGVTVVTEKSTRICSVGQSSQIGKHIV